MSNRIAPFYPIAKIETGQYTAGGEFVLWEDLTVDYVGLYHILPNGQRWTGPSPNDGSKLIVVKRFDASEDVKIYNTNRRVVSNNYVAPINMPPVIETQNYLEGQVLRYFVQQRNNPLNTIHEINRDQFLSINRKNRPGINAAIWRHLVLEWKLSGDLAGHFNKISINTAQRDFPGIQLFLQNPLEFVK